MSAAEQLKETRGHAMRKKISNLCSIRRIRSTSCMLFLLMHGMAWPVSPARAEGKGQGEPSLEVISSSGGPVNDLEVVGDTAYVAVGRRLVILDISNLSAMTEIGSIDLGSTVHGVTLRDGLAYVGTSSPNFFCIVDVANASAPSMVWSSATTPGGILPARSVQFHDDTAYVHVGGSGADASSGDIDVYDVSQPLNPIRLGRLGADLHAYDVSIEGDRLYATTTGVGSHPQGLLIFDLSSPSALNPTQLGIWTVDAPGAETKFPALTVRNSIACVAIVSDYGGPNIQSRVAVVDATVPEAPVELGAISDWGPADLTTFQNILCGRSSIAGTGRTAQRLYNIASPSTPTLLTTYQTHGSVRQIMFSGGLGWALDDGEGLIALDLTNPASPIRLGNYHSPALLMGMAKAGDLLYVVDVWNGFTALDVSQPRSTPTVVGVFQTPLAGIGGPQTNNWGIALREQRAYLTAGAQGLLIVDVANPSAPSLITSLPAPPLWAARAVLVVGNVAHVGYQCTASVCATWLFRSYDVQTFQLLGSVQFSGSANWSLADRGSGILAAAGGESDAQVINAANPANPLQMYAGLPWINPDVACDGSIAIFASNNSAAGGSMEGLHLYDVSNPATPSFRGFVYGNDCNAVAVQNHRAYVTRFNSTSMACVAIDVSDPTAPTEIALCNGVGQSLLSRIYVDEPFVFVAGTAMASPFWTDQGLVILEGSNLDLPPPTSGDGFLYFWNSDALKKSQLDGTGLTTLVSAPATSPSGVGLDLAAGHIYFGSAPSGAGNDKIRRANLDGSEVQDVLTDLSDGPSFVIAVDHDGGMIYWARLFSTSSFIRRANLDGSGIETLHSLPGVRAFDVDLNAGKMYWALAPGLGCVPGAGKIQRSNLDGSNVEDVVTGLMFPGSLALDIPHGEMYFSHVVSETCFPATFLILRANLDGSDVQPVFNPGFTPLSTDVDSTGGKLYIGANPMRRVNLDGTGLESLPILGSSNYVQVQPAPVACPADTNSDSVVNVNDLLAVIGSWGLCGTPPCAGDVHPPGPPPGNGVVDVNDLLSVIANWGPCP